MVSNTIQRRFESDPGYSSSESKVTICQRMSTFPVNIRFFYYLENQGKVPRVGFEPTLYGV